MTRQRRSFDPSFKLEVVKMVKEQGLSVQHVSESMSIGQTAHCRDNAVAERLFLNLKMERV